MIFNGFRSKYFCSYIWKKNSPLEKWRILVHKRGLDLFLFFWSSAKILYAAISHLLNQSHVVPCFIGRSFFGWVQTPKIKIQASKQTNKETKKQTTNMNVKVKLVELSFWSVVLNVIMFCSPKIPEILYTVPCKNNKCHSDHYHRHITSMGTQNLHF